MEVLFCKVGWSLSYNGDINDKPVNGGAYNINRIGHEIHNYKSFNGIYYGYVQSVKDIIRIEKIGADTTDEKAENVLVVWCATKPSGGQVIVGWYKNASVYREHQIVPEDAMQERSLKDHDFYNIKATDICLLPEAERKYVIEGFGQSNVWYGNDGIKERVLEYINNYSKDYENRISKIEKQIAELSGEEKEDIVKIRINQDKFRKLLLEKYSKCCLCGVTCEDFLISSHLKPWRESDKKEKLEVGNGLLLCPNHDKLVDKGFISFDENGKVLISTKLNAINRTFMNIDSKMKIEITEENSAYIKYHREHVFQK